MVDETVAKPAGRGRSRIAWVWSELGLMRAQAELEAHPYVVALEGRQLTAGDLQIFATEFDHVLSGVAVASRRAASRTGVLLQGLADDAHTDVSRWRQFAFATGWSHSSAWEYAEDPFPETSASARFLAGSPKGTDGQLIGRLYMARNLQSDLARAVTGALSSRYDFRASALAWFLRYRSGDPYAEPLEEAVTRTVAAGDAFVLLNSARETSRVIRRFYDSLQDNRVEPVAPLVHPRFTSEKTS